MADGDSDPVIRVHLRDGGYVRIYGQSIGAYADEIEKYPSIAGDDPGSGAHKLILTREITYLEIEVEDA